jgi:hypothetical protein
MCSTSQAQELECHCRNRRYATARCQPPDLEITHVLLQAGRVAALDELSDSVLARQQSQKKNSRADHTRARSMQWKWHCEGINRQRG